MARTRKSVSKTAALLVTKRAVEALGQLLNKVQSFNRERADNEAALRQSRFLAEFEKEFGHLPSETAIAQIKSDAEAWKNARFGDFSVRWTVSCSDGSEVITDSLDDVLAFPNAWSRQIVRISVENEPPRAISASISLGTRFSTKAEVDYEFEGPDEQVLRFSREAQELSEGIVPGYNWIRRIPAFIVLLVSFGVSTMGLFLITSSPEATERVRKMGAVMALIGVFGSPVLIGILFWLAQKYLFPWTLFAINDGEQAQLRYEKRRNVVGIGIVLAAVVGVIVNAISSNLLD